MTRPYGPTPDPRGFPDWFVKRVMPRIKVVNQGCWEWQGSKTRGYARSGPALTATGTSFIHRALWIEMHGPVPDGHEVDHLCFNPSCVNPAHHRLLTVAENRRIGARRWKQRTEVCRNGHPKTGDNLLVMGDGVQRCRICTRESWRVSSVPKNARRKAERAARRAS